MGIKFGCVTESLWATGMQGVVFFHARDLGKGLQRHT